MMYLGTLGRMVTIKCPTTLRVAQSERYTFNVTLGGVVKAQAGPVGRRAWDVGLGSLSTPSDVGTLMEFTTGAWGPGPFWFVPADAPVVNMLTPAASTCDPDALTFTPDAQLLGSPPMDLHDDGYAARSVWKSTSGTTSFGDPVPVISGQPVTGSAWVVGTGRLRLVFMDANGAILSFVESTAAAWSTPQRMAVTTMVPIGAAAVQLRATSGITQAARPALTWTKTAYEWGEGQGCPKAIAHSTARDVTKAWDDPHTGRWSDVSFTIQEVG